MSILQSEINGENVGSTRFRLENTVRLFDSKQKGLENTIKHQEEVISNLQQENFISIEIGVFRKPFVCAKSPNTG